MRFCGRVIVLCLLTCVTAALDHRHICAFLKTPYAKIRMQALTRHGPSLLIIANEFFIKVSSLDRSLHLQQNYIDLSLDEPLKQSKDSMWFELKDYKVPNATYNSQHKLVMFDEHFDWQHQKQWQFYRMTDNRSWLFEKGHRRNLLDDKTKILEYRSIVGTNQWRSFILRLDRPTETHREQQRVLLTPYARPPCASCPLPELHVNLPFSVNNRPLNIDSKAYYLETSSDRSSVCFVAHNSSKRSTASRDLFYFLPWGFSHKNKLYFFSDRMQKVYILQLVKYTSSNQLKPGCSPVIRKHYAEFLRCKPGRIAQVSRLIETNLSQEDYLDGLPTNLPKNTQNLLISLACGLFLLFICLVTFNVWHNHIASKTDRLRNLKKPEEVPGRTYADNWSGGHSLTPASVGSDSRDRSSAETSTEGTTTLT